jgi:hypothetical protein
LKQKELLKDKNGYWDDEDQQQNSNNIMFQLNMQSQSMPMVKPINKEHERLTQNIL